MRRTVSIFPDAPTMDVVSACFVDGADALRLYYGMSKKPPSSRFIGYSQAELDREVKARLLELDLSSAFSIIAVLEGYFRIDYLNRAYRRLKDPLSKRFRHIYKKKGKYASLEDDILAAWKEHTHGSGRVLGEFKRVLRFRHWYAHGRYWTPKLGNQPYDYRTVRFIAETIINSFPFEGRDA